MRPCPAGLKFKVVGKSFRNGNSQAVIDRHAQRLLLVHVTPWHLNTCKPDGIPCHSGEGDLCCVATRHQSRKRWVGARGPEEIEEGGRAHKPHLRRGRTTWRGKACREGAGRYDEEASAPRRRHASIGSSVGGHSHAQRSRGIQSG